MGVSVRAPTKKHMEGILVVDDERSNLDLIKHLLEEEGIKVQCAECGEEAIRMMKEKAFLLMITDLNMPGINGLELARKARIIAPHMPIIMNSGEMSPHIEHLAVAAGVTMVLAKPFRATEMLELVGKVAGAKGRP